MMSNRGHQLTQFDITPLYATAYNSSATVDSATKGFCITEIWPFDNAVFDAELQVPLQATPPGRQGPANPPAAQGQSCLQLPMGQPTLQLPQDQPEPTLQPTKGHPKPTLQPLETQPTLQPPKNQPTLQPPKNQSTLQPPKNQPTLQPSKNQPTLQPSKNQPTLQPSKNQPTLQPSKNQPTLQPSKNQPTFQPSKNQTTLQSFKNQPILQSSKSQRIHQPSKMKMGKGHVSFVANHLAAADPAKDGSCAFLAADGTRGMHSNATYGICWYVNPMMILIVLQLRLHGTLEECLFFVNRDVLICLFSDSFTNKAFGLHLSLTLSVITCINSYRCNWGVNHQGSIT